MQISLYVEKFTSLLFIGYQLFQELVAFKGAESISGHFSSWWKFNDALWMPLSPLIVFAATTGEVLWIPRETLVTLSAVVAFSMMIKLLYWLKLFKSTGLAITLIGETLKDSWAFLLILASALIMFGVPLSIIDFNRQEDESDTVM